MYKVYFVSLYEWFIDDYDKANFKNKKIKEKKNVFLVLLNSKNILSNYV